VLNTARIGLAFWGFLRLYFADNYTVTTTARLEDYSAYWWPFWTMTVDSKFFPEIWNFSSLSYFEVRGITVWLDWEFIWLTPMMVV